MRNATWFMVATPLLAALVIAPVAADDPTPGSWEKVPVTNPDVVAAAEFAVAAHAREMSAPSDGGPATLELVEILAAEQQVVAGVNYRLLLSVKHDKETQAAEATVWWQAWRKPDPYQLTSWTWKAARGD
jgi:hypothetical protein